MRSHRLRRPVIGDGKVLVLERRPVRQRDLAVHGWVPVGDGVTVARREATGVYHAGDTVRPPVHRGMSDRTAGAVPAENNLAAGRARGSRSPQDRVEVIAQRDPGAVSVLRLHAGAA